MKFTHFPAKVIAVVFLLSLWSCTADSVEPGVTSSDNSANLVSNGHPHPVISPECSPRVVCPLMDESGGLDVNYFGPFGTNTGNPDPWGAVTVVNSDSNLVMEIDLAYGWYLDVAETFIGQESLISLVNGIPTVDNTWEETNVTPLVNTTEIWTPIASLPSTCFDFAVRLSVVRMDFFQGIDPLSRTNLWVYNSAWNDPNQPTKNSSSFAINGWCIAACPVLSQRGPVAIH